MIQSNWQTCYLNTRVFRFSLLLFCFTARGPCKKIMKLSSCCCRWLEKDICFTNAHHQKCNTFKVLLFNTFWEGGCAPHQNFFHIHTCEGQKTEPSFLWEYANHTPFYQSLSLSVAAKHLWEYLAHAHFEKRSFARFLSLCVCSFNLVYLEAIQTLDRHAR